MKNEYNNAEGGWRRAEGGGRLCYAKQCPAEFPDIWGITDNWLIESNKVEKGVGWSIMDIPSITLFLGLLTRSQPHMEVAWLEGQTHYRVISSKMQIQLTVEDSKVRRL